ncbi:arylesterase [Thiomicrorhabdus sp. Milos-T2]|uniref:arylesterase n=1 Tax=Thiomicrorhabdus sp. Milos-T2 TaxID=90814 RepID=UPI000493F150|nr:arylesterase [Thiomicrorhabdus sp. Milos-T2]
MKMNTIPAGLVTLVLSIVTTVLLLSSCSQAKLPVLQSEDVVVAFGDSLTVGYGVQKNQSYPSVLAKMTGLNIINSGISGETTQQGLARLSKVLVEYKPHLVILLEGGNDVLQKVPESQIKANLARMISMIQNSGSAVLLVGVPEKKLFGSSLELYSELANQFNIPLEEDIVADLIKRPSMKSDYVHFNAQGYQALAQAIHKQLKSSGAIH